MEFETPSDYTCPCQIVRFTPRNFNIAPQLFMAAVYWGSPTSFYSQIVWISFYLLPRKFHYCITMRLNYAPLGWVKPWKRARLTSWDATKKNFRSKKKKIEQRELLRNFPSHFYKSLHSEHHFLHKIAQKWNVCTIFPFHTPLSRKILLLRTSYGKKF